MTVAHRLRTGRRENESPSRPYERVSGHNSVQRTRRVLSTTPPSSKCVSDSIIVVANRGRDEVFAAMAMSSRLAGRLLRRSTVAHPWRPLSASAPEQQPLQSHQFAFGLRRALGSLGLGLKGSESSGNGGFATGRRFFGASSMVQQQSLVTAAEVQKELQSGADTVAQTAELVAQTREMQLKSIDEARASIFGHVIGNGDRSAHKVLRRKMIGQKIVSWYPTPIQKQDPMFEDPKIKRRAVKNERLKRRGKGPPKKGHGKRAAKRAK